MKVGDEAGQDWALRAVELGKRYGSLTAVDSLSLSIRQGEILGFLGPNGAGKTTTLKMLCGLLRPDSGWVEIGGERLSPGKSELLRHIGVAPQEIVVWETLSCAEQLAFVAECFGASRRAAKRRAAELLEAFGLSEKADRLAKTLSGGMQRRLNIALGLVHSPRILFLDEPQAGLDPQSRVLVREVIRGLAGSMTIVITTHDMEEAEKLADRVCIVDRGKLLAFDTIDGVKQSQGQCDQFTIELLEDAAGLARALAELERQRAREREQGCCEQDEAQGSVQLIDERTVRFGSCDGTATLTQVLQLVEALGLHLAQLRMHKVTLEDVFIRLTGRRLRE